jgi:hypothetical protein
MNRFSITLAAALALTAYAARAEYAPNAEGNWVDARHHTAAGAEFEGRLEYAKVTCRAKTGTVAGVRVGPGWEACMARDGFAWVPASPAQIAVRERAEQGERNIAAAHAVGQALIGIANDLNRPQPQPQHCNGFIYRGGDINMNCN